MNIPITIETTINDIEGELLETSETLATCGKILRNIDEISNQHDATMHIADIHSIGRIIQSTANTISQLSEYVRLLQKAVTTETREEIPQ